MDSNRNKEERPTKTEATVVGLCAFVLWNWGLRCLWSTNHGTCPAQPCIQTQMIAFPFQFTSIYGLIVYVVFIELFSSPSFSDLTFVWFYGQMTEMIFTVSLPVSSLITAPSELVNSFYCFWVKDSFSAVSTSHHTPSPWNCCHLSRKSVNTWHAAAGVPASLALPLEPAAPPVPCSWAKDHTSATSSLSKKWIKTVII